MTETIETPKAVLFDLDGTLVDSYEAIWRSVNHVRQIRGLEALPMATVRGAVGNGLLRLVELTIPAGDRDANAQLFTEHHPTILADGTHPLPGVRAVLPALRSAGLRLGVCSNKPIALTQKLLQMLDLGRHFEVVLGPELVAKQKPAPDMLWEALRQLGVEPARAIYVGDMTIDIQTGRAAGVATWVIASGSHDEATLRAARPERLLDRLEELLEPISSETPIPSGRSRG